MKKETYFVQQIHKYLKPYGVYYEKTHNPYRAGIPDVWYSGPQSDLWVEYKFLLKLPAKFRGAPLTMLQHKWLEDRYKEGRKVAVIVGLSYHKGVILTDMQWREMFTKSDFLAKAQEVEIIARWIATIVGGSYDESRSGKDSREAIANFKDALSQLWASDSSL